jgi:hypothetical protein
LYESQKWQDGQIDDDEELAEQSNEKQFTVLADA